MYPYLFDQQIFYILKAGIYIESLKPKTQFLTKLKKEEVFNSLGFSLFETSKMNLQWTFNFEQKKDYINCFYFQIFSADYITPCVGLKPACLKKNIQETIPRFVKGIPSLGVNSTDPLTYDYVNVELPGGLKIEFKDGVLKGLRNCLVNDAR